MTYFVTLTFEVKGLKNKQEASEFGNSLAEHVTDTFNDNGSIDPGVWVKAERKPS